MGPIMFCNFNLVENRRIANDSTNAKAREKICTDLEFSDLQKFFDACLTEFKKTITF